MPVLAGYLKVADYHPLYMDWESFTLASSLKHKLGVDSVRPQIQLLLLPEVQLAVNFLTFLGLFPVLWNELPLILSTLTGNYTFVLYQDQEMCLTYRALNKW